MQLDPIAIVKTSGILVVSVLLLQSCATFRSSIDASCVDRFATEYPDPQDSRFVLPWRAGESFDEANLVGIEHDGGFLSWYAHLTFDGALVQVDDQVSKGDIIAHSGNTGRSAYPHLHFFVQQLNEECHDAESKTADLGLCPQVPVSFSNVSPSKAVLEEWVTYTAM